jgi:hypothetical protein
MPGNGSSSVCGTPSDNQLSAAAFSQSSSGILHIVAAPCGGNRQLVISGPAGLGGTFYMDFTGGPTVGETFNVMTATTINGSFADYQTNMKSVFGQIIYLSQSIQFKVIANDVIFIDGAPSCVARCAPRCGQSVYSTQLLFSSSPSLDRAAVFSSP